MVTVCEKDQCAGCMACLEVCSKNAINIKDSIKSYNAIIDEKRCINCNACRNVCQVNNNVDVSKPIIWKQGWASDVNIEEKSSSGWTAAAIARSFVENGGTLCKLFFTR
ncbi:MAG: 4Fe-4S dicluster domain-containing protein [Mediterraneibacter faecis]